MCKQNLKTIRLYNLERNTSILLVWVSVVVLFVFSSCQKGGDLNNSHPAYWDIPRGFPEPVYSFKNNERDKDVFELGRELFYDPIFSLDSSISCGSCHIQAHAFSDTTQLSLGVHERIGKRNSPALFNLVWNSSFMWDGGINHIEVMPLAPITDSSEMAMPVRRVNDRLNANPHYRSRFKQVMQSDSISDRQYLLALSQFIGSLISDNSPYDQYQAGDTNALSSESLKGLELFKVTCAKCHSFPLFTDFSFRSNGTFIAGKDLGRATITELVSDYGLFKVPSLRNIALTGPYMHDGRFESLEEVLDHYRFGINGREDLDPTLAEGVVLTDEEAAQIIQFLHDLTDISFIQQPYFSNPW